MAQEIAARGALKKALAPEGTKVYRTPATRPPANANASPESSPEPATHLPLPNRASVGEGRPILVKRTGATATSPRRKQRAAPQRTPHPPQSFRLLGLSLALCVLTILSLSLSRSHSSAHLSRSLSVSPDIRCDRARRPPHFCPQTPPAPRAAPGSRSLLFRATAGDPNEKEENIKK